MSNVCAACPSSKFKAWTAGATVVTDCRACPAGKYVGAGASTTCTNCPSGTYSETGVTSLQHCKLCLDSERSYPGQDGSPSWSNYSTYVLGNYAPAGSTSASACQNTKSVCPNVPIFAEMQHAHLTDISCGGPACVARFTDGSSSRRNTCAMRR